ncbi:maleylacetoacetate isomerase [Undibacterium sp. Ren11W]|uniref:maleylacetoacetate isomerase n=1 Tax=Undibacterium sp. Ren11W TaxID=3413045 RepID=UPI003BEF7DE4
MKLYGYFRSSASYRVRIALNLKGLAYDSEAVHLVKNGGEQLSASFRTLNPEALVPALVDEHEGVELALSQSLAIMEYLEEKYPASALLPKNLADRAHVRALALAIACDVHPLSNLRVLKYLTGTLGISEEQKNTWYQHWCMTGLSALETKIAADPRSGKFCYGDTPTLADCCLVPQIYNAQRFKCDLSTTPQLMRIHQNCMELQAFILAAPGNQADAE